jgi:hypothetical protein
MSLDFDSSFKTSLLNGAWPKIRGKQPIIAVDCLLSSHSTIGDSHRLSHPLPYSSRRQYQSEIRECTMHRIRLALLLLQNKEHLQTTRTPPEQSII